MTNPTFYQKFNDNIPRIQEYASELTNDFDTARYLYLETAHQAIKHKNTLKKESFDKWLVSTMKKAFSKVQYKAA